MIQSALKDTVAPLRRGTRVIRGRHRLPPYRNEFPVDRQPQKKEWPAAPPLPPPIVSITPPPPPTATPPVTPTTSGSGTSSSSSMLAVTPLPPPTGLLYGDDSEENDICKNDDWGSPKSLSPKVGDPLILEHLEPVPLRHLTQDNLIQCEDYNPVNIWVKPNSFDHAHVRKILQKVRDLGTSFGDCQPHTVSEQLKEYFDQLKAMEKRRVRFLERSPQIGRRPDVMKFISNVCFCEKYEVETLVHAIYLYDRFADAHNIEERQIFLVALVCVVLSAKLEENDDHTPNMSKIHKRYVPKGTDDYYPLFVAMEAFVLRFYEFKIVVPTEVNFLDCYLLFGLDGYGTDIFYEMYKYQNKKTYMGNYGEMLYDLHEYCRRLCKAVAITAPSPPHRASLVAAAILLFARRECHMNFWTHKLGSVTGHDWEDILHTLKTFIEPCIRQYTGTGDFPIKSRRDPVLVNFFNFRRNPRRNLFKSRRTLSLKTQI